MTIIAQTPRLTIREFLPDEEDAFIVLHADEQVLKYIPNRSEAENRKIFKDSLAAYVAGESLNRWGIFDANDGDFMGACLLRAPVAAPEKVELGYSFAVKYWGKGLATEMAKAMINYVFTILKAPVICAVTHPDNIPSQNVLLKAGMQQLDDVSWYESKLPYFEIRNS